MDTKNHAIYTELTRVKQYFEKIQKLETPPAERETKVNTEAVARFVKNDLVCYLIALLVNHTLTLSRLEATKISKTN